MGLFAPCPAIRHPRHGNGLDTCLNRFFSQLCGANPGRIVLATHVADLVNPSLQWGNSAADEGPQKVIARQPGFVKHLDEAMDCIDLRD